METWSNLINVLVQVEDVAGPESGRLAFGAQANAGAIFVERGRICWVVARGMSRRLHEILQSYSHDQSVDFGAIYQRCSASKTHLGQTLVDEGYISPHELEVSLRRHSAESLLALCQTELGELVWTSRGERGYEPRFTFRPVDVLVDVVALRTPEIHARARTVLQHFDAPGRAGGAYRLDGHDAMPVAVVGDLSVYELWSIGQWAANLPGATRELGSASQLAIATTDADDTIAVWWRGDLLYAVVCDDRRALGEVMNYLEDAA